MALKELTGHWKKLVSDPKYLSDADFGPGEEKVATIDYTARDMVQNAEGKAEKVVLHFKENIKPLVLNVTNSKAIAKVTGKQEVQDWKGQRILLYVDPRVKAFGDIVRAVRVRPYAPRASQLPPAEATIPCSKCGNNIKPFGKMTTAAMAEYTKKQYGQALCSDCATAAAEEKKGAGEENARTE